MIEKVVKDYKYNDDGTVSFLCHHMCSNTYGLSSEMSKREMDYITKYISSNAGEFQCWDTKRSATTLFTDDFYNN